MRFTIRFAVMTTVCLALCVSALAEETAVDGHGSSLGETVQSYLDHGVPAEKLHCGLAFYGRAYGGVPDVDHGLGIHPFASAR